MNSGVIGAAISLNRLSLLRTAWKISFAPLAVRRTRLGLCPVFPAAPPVLESPWEAGFHPDALLPPVGSPERDPQRP